jgi:hypothetical protein
MGKGWDASGIAFSVALWREVLRVLKPGGYILAFGGTRTYHRMTCAIEDAGADIRDCILAWKYGSGFPKSMNVSIAIDKASGAMGHRGKRVSVAGNRLNGGEDVPNAFGVAAHEPITDDAKAWAGWGTALKPAWEPVVVARKPLEGTVAANVLKYGTGAMNIDASRVPTSDRLGGGHSSSGQQMSDGWHRPWMDDPEAVEANAARSRAAVEKAEALGRWPANILLTHAPDCSDEGCVAGCPCAAMDEQSGGDGASRFFNRLPIEEDDLVPFFYTPKASRSEREAGLHVGNMLCSCEATRREWDEEDRQAVIRAETGTSRLAATIGSMTGDASAWPTTLSGSSTTVERSLKASTYTTSTETNSTTESITSSRSRNLSTSASTPDVNGETESGGSPVVFAESTSPSTRVGSTSLQTEAPCTDAAEAATSGSSLPPSGHGSRVCPRCRKPESKNGSVWCSHPTVKPISIMEWCLTLVAREGAVVLDPFMGSGTTGIAAVRCKVNFIGIEREEEYLRIAEARIRHHGGDPEKA